MGRDWELSIAQHYPALFGVYICILRGYCLIWFCGSKICL